MIYNKKYDIHKSKYHSVSGIYMSGLRKHRPDIDMANNFVVLSRFQ